MNPWLFYTYAVIAIALLCFVYWSKDKNDGDMA